MIKKILLAHAILESMAGVILILRPEMLLMTEGQTISTLVVSKLYGVLAFIVGVISYLLWKNFEYSDLFRRIILAFTTFHLMIAFQMYAAYNQAVVGNIGAAILHATFALLFVFSYMNSDFQRSK